MSVGKKIRQLRKEKNWTQENLAKKLKVLQPHVNRWEKNKCAPSLEALKKLSELFNISIDNLIFDEKDLKKIDIKDRSLLEKIKQFDKLSPRDRETIINLIETFSLKNSD